MHRHPEVVTAQLVSAFTFSPSKNKEVIWRTGIIMTPAVKGDKDTRPQLPLQVSLV